MGSGGSQVRWVASHGLGVVPDTHWLGVTHGPALGLGVAHSGELRLGRGTVGIAHGGELRLVVIDAAHLDLSGSLSLSLCLGLGLSLCLRISVALRFSISISISISISLGLTSVGTVVQPRRPAEARLVDRCERSAVGRQGRASVARARYHGDRGRRRRRPADRGRTQRGVQPRVQPRIIAVRLLCRRMLALPLQLHLARAVNAHVIASWGVAAQIRAWLPIAG